MFASLMAYMSFLLLALAGMPASFAIYNDSADGLMQWAVQRCGQDVVDVHQRLVNEQMQHWKQAKQGIGLSAADVVADSADGTLLVTVKNGALTVGLSWTGAKLNWAYLHELRQLVSSLGMPVPDMVLRLNPHDEPQATPDSKSPCFGYCRWKDTFDLLLPYPYPMLSAHEAMSLLRRDIRAGSNDTRKPIAVLRNSLGGHGGWLKGRKAINDEALAHPDVLDVGLVARDTDQAERHEKEGLKQYEKPQLSNKEQADGYRYTIHVPGQCAAVRLWSVMLSDMLVLKVANAEVEWYYPLLKPWEHYVPVEFNGTHTDVVQKVLWARENPDKVREMVIAAQSTIFKYVASPARECYVGVLLSSYARAFANKWSNRKLRGAHA